MQPDSDESPMGDFADVSSRYTLKEELAKCVVCHGSFESTVVFVSGEMFTKQTVCDKCDSQVTPKTRKMDDRLKSWESIVPPSYLKELDFDILEKKGVDMNEVQRALNHPFGSKGIAMIGESRRGKTRVMFALLREYYLSGKSVVYVNMANFADELVALYDKGSSAPNELIKKLQTCDCLFLDDIGKEKLTDRGETAIYRIIEQRTAYERPVYFTSNMNGKVLSEKMVANNGDRATPIIERLRENCIGIVL